VCHHPVPENNRPFSRPPIQINKEIDYYLIVVPPLFSCPKNFLDGGGAAFPPFPSLSLPVTPLCPVIYYPIYIYNGSQYSRGIS